MHRYLGIEFRKDGNSNMVSLFALRVFLAIDLSFVQNGNKPH